MHKVTKSIFLKSFSNFIAIGLGLFTSVLLSRYLGKENYGLLIILYSVIGFFAGFTDLGTRWTFNRFIPKLLASHDQIECRRLVITGFIIQLIGLAIFSAIIFFFADLISTFFHKKELIFLLKIGIVYFISFSLVNLIIQLFQGLQDWRKESLINIIFPLFFTLSILTLVFIFKNINIKNVILANACAAILSFLISIFFIPKYILSKPYISFFEFKDKVNLIFLFGAPMLLGQFNFFLNGWFDKIFIGRYCKAEDLAFYYIAFLFFNGLIMVVKIIETVLKPFIAGIVLDNRDDIKRRFQLIFRWFMHFSIFLSLISFFLISPIVKILYGREYQPTIFLFRLSLATFILRSLIITYGIFMVNVFNRTKGSAILTTFLTVSNIIFNIIFIPRFGIIGGIYAGIFSYVVYWLAIIFSVDFVRSMAPILSIFKVIPMLIFIIIINYVALFFGFYNLFIMCIVSLVSYIVLMNTFGEFKEADLCLIKSMVKWKK